MLGVIRKAASLLFQFTWIGYVIEKMAVARKGVFFPPGILKNAHQYHRESIKAGEIHGKKRVVLVEMMWEHPGANFNMCLVSLLLGKKYSTNVFALTEFGNVNLVKTIAEAFGISQFVGIYKWFDLKNHLKAMSRTVYLGFTCSYNINKGISLKVDDQEVGDLVYDEYLRLTWEPTVVKMDLIYLALLYNSMYRYYRYKEIIVGGGVTDIVITHDVYAKFGLVIKAAAAVSDNITIWTTMYTKPISIARNLANKKEIYKSQFYKKEYGEMIRGSRSVAEIEKEFSLVFDERMEAKDSNQIDVCFVYANNDINTEEAFKKAYPGDGRKKVFVMAHALVDAVRYPLWQNYSDNYVWLKQTLILLANRSKEEAIYVKSHPSEVLYPCTTSVKDVVNDVNKSLGVQFVYLDKKVHNSVIFKLAKAIVTSHGSVGIEAPCLGVPVITSSSCQYEETGAIFQAKSTAEYQVLLDGIDQMPPLTQDQIMSAKIAFLWFNKNVYVDSDILPGLSRYEGEERIEAYVKIDNAFVAAKSIEQQEIYKAFSRMIDRADSDFVGLYKENTDALELVRL